MHEIWDGIRRLWWSISLAVLGALSVFGIITLPQFAEDSKVALVFYKASLITVLWIVWHVLRHDTMGYLKFKEALAAADPNARAIAVAIVVGLTCVAVVLGGMMGL
jgi:hypothetical protein